MTDRDDLVSQLIDYKKTYSLSTKQLASRIGIPLSTVEKWFQKGKSATKPGTESYRRIKIFLETEEEKADFVVVKEARNRSESIRFLLLLLMKELGWFRDGTTVAREILRKELDFNDIGYISSLLSMLSNEDKFNRWVTLTTHKFKHLGGR